MKENFERSLTNLWLKTLTFSYQKLAKPASTFFRRIFEFKKIKESLGILFLLVALLINLSSHSVDAIQTIVATNLIKLTPEAVELVTKQSLQKPLGIFHITKQFSALHPATDLATDAGSAVVPILPGKVEKVSYGYFGYGNHVIINHGSGFTSLYAHFAKINISEGQQVDNNTIIGLIGSTGWSTGPHLHLEIIDNGQKINPKVFLESYLGEKLASDK